MEGSWVTHLHRCTISTRFVGCELLQRSLSQLCASFLLVYPQGHMNLSVNLQACSECTCDDEMHLALFRLCDAWSLGAELAKAPNNSGQDRCQILSQVLTFTSMFDALKH